MKYWALTCALLVGCYQPSAAERYNAESEALDHLNSQVGRLAKLKAAAESVDPPHAVTAEWNKRQNEYETLVKVAEQQAQKVSKMGMALGQ